MYDNKNKVHNKCNVLDSSPNHPSSLPVHKKIVFHETGSQGPRGWGLMVYRVISFVIVIFKILDNQQEPIGQHGEGGCCSTFCNNVNVKEFEKEQIHVYV